MWVATALFPKAHHSWPTSKSETISHNKASLEQGEVSFPNWAGRVCLGDCWARQNLSRLYGQPWIQQAPVLVDISGGYSALKSAIEHRLFPGSYPDSCTLKGSPCRRKRAGPSDANRRMVLWDAVHTSCKAVTEWLGDGSSSHIVLFLKDLWCLYRLSVHKRFPL